MKRQRCVFGDMPQWSLTTGEWGVVRGGRFIPARVVERAQPAQDAPVSDGAQPEDGHDIKQSREGAE